MAPSALTTKTNKLVAISLRTFSMFFPFCNPQRESNKLYFVEWFHTFCSPVKLFKSNKLYFVVRFHTVCIRDKLANYAHLSSLTGETIRMKPFNEI